MKTKRFIIMVILFITGGFFMNMSAQEALNAIAKKCETMDEIVTSVIKERDKVTKKLTRYVLSVEFKDNEMLKKEILSAFEKDKEMADKETKTYRNGLLSLVYVLGESIYTFTEEENGTVTFWVNETFRDKK